MGEDYKVDIDDVRPTQFAVGVKEVEYQAEKIAKKDSDGELADYKKKKIGTVVIGPNGVLYLVDGHHFARSLLKYGSTTMWIEIEKDYSDLDGSDFWAKMKEKNFMYLKDETGTTRKPSELPKKFSALKNDPYRSLAWMVRKSDGFSNDDDTPFLEFLWADFFRSRIELSANASPAGWKKALKEAMKLAESNKTSHLPGWSGDEGDCSEILDWLGKN